MTVRFLSDEWIALVQERLNGSDAFRAAASSVSATVQQVVPAPDGERRYWIRLDGGSVTVGPGDASEPDVTITQDLATAVQAHVALGLLDGLSSVYVQLWRGQGQRIVLSSELDVLHDELYVLACAVDDAERDPLPTDAEVEVERDLDHYDSWSEPAAGPVLFDQDDHDDPSGAPNAPGAPGAPLDPLLAPRRPQ